MQTKKLTNKNELRRVFVRDDRPKEARKNKQRIWSECKIWET